MNKAHTDLISADRAVAETVNGAVLCIIDFNNDASNVLHAAIRIAAASKSKLTVLYPYRLNQVRSVPEISLWKKTIDTDAKNNFDRMTEILLKEYPIVCEFKPEVGFLNDRVNAYAEKNQIGMVVLGKQTVMVNREAVSEMFNQLECPLLIIPQQQNQQQ